MPPGIGYGSYGATRSPVLRQYLDSRRQMQTPQMPQGGGGYGMQPMPQAPSMPQAPQGRMLPMPNYGMQGAGMSPMQPQGGRLGQLPGIAPRQPSKFEQDVSNLPDNYEKMWGEFHNSLYAGPDFKGRHEMAQMLGAQYAQQLALMASQPEVDLSGYSEVSDRFGANRQRMTDQLAARGFSGSGIEAGALANTYGQEARAQGAFVRDAYEQRRREELALQQRFMDYARQVGLMGLQRNWQEQDDPGFWGDVLGVVGNIGGALLPGVGNIFGGGGNSKAPQTGVLSGPVDYDEEYAWGGPY